MAAQDEPSALSPHAKQPPSPIRGLSAQEYDELHSARGMGTARAAELNSYPGPRHVLDLAEQLELDAEVAAQIETTYADMDTEAKRLGAELLAREQALNHAFAQGTVTDEQLAAQMTELGGLSGRLRGVHMRAHVAVRQLLTPNQIDTYNRLRGYATSAGHAMHHQGGS